jgi:hypothetical protein
MCGGPAPVRRTALRIAKALRRFIPLLAIYLVAAAHRSPFREIVPWHEEMGNVGRVQDASVAISGRAVSAASAAYGAVVYHVERSHVGMLRRRRTAPAA